VGLSRHDRSFRLFLGYQLQEQLPLNIVFGQSELPFKYSQVFAVYEFFHRILLSEELVQVGDPRSRPASQAPRPILSDRLGGRGADGMAADYSNVLMSHADAP
jgi:hypothetical protein